MSSLEQTSIDSEEMTEFDTRKNLIDSSLVRSGWVRNVDWREEVELQGMPNAAGVGFADYVLLGDDGKPLAVIEAKRTSKDPAVGRQQAKLYADLLEKKYKRRPVIFLTNGYDTRIWDDQHYPEREVSEIYSKRDLEKLININTNRSPRLSDAVIRDDISGRYYQKSAIQSVCSAFEQNRRHALLVMATGSGKTRTVISLVDVLMRKGWIKNVLFLADRNSLVTQAKRSFVNLMPDLSVTNMCESGRDPNARCVFSTYQTMINLIDRTLDEKGNVVFTNGHFDLIITDEAHRSIYRKYREIFTYFDSLLIGLTATPKDDVDKNTYEIFKLPRGEPTYGYELGQAVIDQYLVDYKTMEVKVKFMEDGITYSELTEEERDEYEEIFIEEDGFIPDKIESTKLNEWVFNRDTIVRVLDSLMTHGLRVNSGSMVGKTIIFAKNHNHAEVIRKVFDEEYPTYPKGYCRVIDNQCNYAQTLIDEFSKSDSMPQIAVSVDMLDTGIDVPEILNLVFFKKVYSKAKFWQMIGRGTRLCPGLVDGKDKEGFLIFDFCSNFEFFRMTPKGMEAGNIVSIQGAIFGIKAELALQLQDEAFQEPEFMDFRNWLVDDILFKINELNPENFAVRQHLRYVEHYSKREVLDGLTFDDVKIMKNELSSLILPYQYDPGAIRMDALIAKIELGYVLGGIKPAFLSNLRGIATALSMKATIPDVSKHLEIIRLINSEGFLESANIPTFERIRVELRDLIKYLDRSNPVIYNINFLDEILAMEQHESDITDDSLASYREKAEHYIRNHRDDDVILKLRTNDSLTPEDVARLEGILWSEVGSKEDYEAQIGSKPLQLFVREITGLDMKAAKEAFSRYLDDSTLNSQQIYFINQIIEYVVQNGVISDFHVFMESPFTDRGSIVDLFPDLSIWAGIKGIVDDINEKGGIGQSS